MSIVFITLGSLLLILGLSFGVKSIKPIYFNLISGLIIIIGTFFGLFGKLLQDKKSSEKADRILKTSESTELRVNELQDNTKRLQYPLPTEIEISFHLDFTLSPTTFQKFTSIVSKRRIQFNHAVAGRGFPLPTSVLNDILNWSEYCALVFVHFSKNYQSGPSVESVLSFTNQELISRHYRGQTYPMEISLYYFPLEKTFLLTFDRLKLELDKSLLAIAGDNYGVKSTIDLKESTLLLSIGCIQQMESTEINWLKITSNEFNLIKPKMEKAHGNDLFLTRSLKSFE